MDSLNDRNLHVVYASDDKFAEILGVSLVSLYEKNTEMEEIHIYVLDSGVSDVNKKRLCSICDKYRRKSIRFISARDISKILSMSVSTDRGSLSQYARMFVSRDLPETLERVLYLDCDIIINDSLYEFWNLDLKGKTIAALKDAFSRQYRKNIELQPDDIMFNSGVMLIDMMKWKEKNIEKRLLSFIKRHNGVIQQGDQGALNAVLSKDTYCFHPRFNSVTIFYDFTYEEMLVYRKPVDFYSKKEVKQAVEHPVIIHFTTSFLSERPWVEGCKHRYVSEWMRYKAISPWNETPLWKPQNSGIKGIYKKLMKYMPRRWMIDISSVLQVYGRPLYYIFKR